MTSNEYKIELPGSGFGGWYGRISHPEAGTDPYVSNLRFEIDCLRSKLRIEKHRLDYKKVIFNPPATIVIWEDGSKTVVMCGEKDVYDKEKGLALCFMKKALGNRSRFLNDILHREIKTED